jgi:cysteine desulfurase
MVGPGHAAGYFDHGATTPMEPVAIDAMVRVLRNEFGNPSGAHAVSRSARRLLDDARDSVAALLGAQPREVAFTGGGTEALNMAISGTLSLVAPGSVVLTSAVEHDAVRNTAIAWGARGMVHEEIAVLDSGVVDLVDLARRLERSDGKPGGAMVAVVAVMLVNNEVGTIQPIRDVISLVRRMAPHAVVVVDAVQAGCWLDIAEHTAGADFVAVSAHKFGGPKGTGALVVREGVQVAPIVFGGGQERERRSGTQNVAGVIGMVAALRHAQEHRVAVGQRVAKLRDQLADGLLQSVVGSWETGDRTRKVANNAHLCFDGIESESLLVLLDDVGIAASAGVMALHVSHVLLAMGVPQERAVGSLRLTLGVSTTVHDIEHAVAAIPAAVARLRF